MLSKNKLSLEKYPQELNGLADSSDELFDYAQEGQEAIEKLIDMKTALEQTVDDLRGLALEMTKQYSSSIYKKLGVTDTSVSLESNNTNNKEIAIESIGQKVKDILKAIWAFITKAFNKAKQFLSRLFGFNKKLEEKAEEIIVTVKEYKSETFTADFVDFMTSFAEADQSTQNVIDKFTESNRTQEAVKKTDIVQELKQMRQKAKQQAPETLVTKKLDDVLNGFSGSSQASKSMTVGSHISSLLISDGRDIKPSDLVNKLKNLYQLTDEIIKYNSNVYKFWIKYDDLIEKESGDTFFKSFMDKQQESFYSELNAPSSFKVLKDNEGSDYRKQFASQSGYYPLDMNVIVSVPVFKPVNNGNVVENDIHVWANNLTLASACHVETSVETGTGSKRSIPVLSLSEIQEISELVSKSSNMLQRTENYLVTKLEFFERAGDNKSSKYDRFSASQTFKQNDHSNKLWQFVNTCQMDLSKVVSKDILNFFSEVSKINKACLEYCEKSKSAYSQSSGNLQKLLDSVEQ